MIRRNALLESAISILVVCIVAELGITVPGLHHAMIMRMAQSTGESPQDVGVQQPPVKSRDLGLPGA